MMDLKGKKERHTGGDGVVFAVYVYIYGARSGSTKNRFSIKIGTLKNITMK